MTLIISNISHVDHDLTKVHMDWIQEATEGLTEFFAKTLTLPDWLDPVPSAIYGPIAGDPPVPEDSVFYAVRGTRQNPSRMVSWSPRQSRLVTVIAGPDDTGVMVLYTAFGGPLAPQEPWDPNCRNVAESQAFWAQHALSAPAFSVEYPLNDNCGCMANCVHDKKLQQELRDQFNGPDPNRCKVCGGFYGDYGICVTVGCPGDHSTGL